MKNFPSPSAGCRIALASAFIVLAQPGCTVLRRAMEPKAPPPPAALQDLEEPAIRLPALASHLVAPASARGDKDVRALFEAWQTAWQAGDFDAFLTHYAPAYSGNGTPALRWQMRRLRMVQGKTRQAVLDFSQPETEMLGNGEARLSFQQHFEDGELAEIGTKQWQMRQTNGRWLIEQEIFEHR